MSAYFLPAILGEDDLAGRLAVLAQPMPSGDRVPILRRLWVRRIPILHQVRRPLHLAVVIQNLQTAVQRRVHHGVVLINPRLRLVEEGNAARSALRGGGAGGEDRNGGGRLDVELSLDEGQELLGEGEILQGAGEMRLGSIAAGGVEGALFVGDGAVE